MSDLLSLTVSDVAATVVKIEMIYNGASYDVLCTCRISTLGTTIDDVVVRVPISKDFKLHVDMFTAAVLSTLKESKDGA